MCVCVWICKYTRLLSLHFTFFSPHIRTYLFVNRTTQPLSNSSWVITASLVSYTSPCVSLCVVKKQEPSLLWLDNMKYAHTYVHMYVLTAHTCTVLICTYVCMYIYSSISCLTDIAKAQMQVLHWKLPVPMLRALSMGEDPKIHNRNDYLHHHVTTSWNTSQSKEYLNQVDQHSLFLGWNVAVSAVPR